MYLSKSIISREGCDVMKNFTITETNLSEVYGLLRKFFYNNKGTGFVAWHNFDCGLKNVKSSFVARDKTLITTKQKYHAPISIELDKKMKLIRIHLIVGEGFCIDIGDKVCFLSGKLIIRTEEYFIPEHNYCYQVFQVLPLSNDDESDISLRERLNQIENDDWY